jgi:hypothetical protein
MHPQTEPRESPTFDNQQASMKRARLIVLSIFAIVCFLLLCKNLCAQKQLDWQGERYYDTGNQTAVAVLPTGGLILEFHQSEKSNNGLWYHVGRAYKLSSGKQAVVWSDSHPLDYSGNWPNATVTREGYVILVYSENGNKTLRYSIGKINPAGSDGQTIDWKLTEQIFDSGFHPSISVNSSGKFVEVHESGSGGKGIYYRIGHLQDPASGQYNIVWDTGVKGTSYDDGINPHIALNDKNQIIEVHQVGSEKKLHYHRGLLVGNSVLFEKSVRYNDSAEQPAVTLTNDGTVVECHIDDRQTFCLTGVLNARDSSVVDWSTSSVLIGSYGYPNHYPAVSTDGKLTVSTFDKSGTPWTDGSNLYSNMANFK